MKRLIAFIKSLLLKNNIFFIGATDKLLPPLSVSDELDLARKKVLGDEAARERLIEHNLRLVVFLAKKYENTGVDLEDLVSIGSIGLIKGVDTYKPDKNIRLATYVSRCISNEILMFLRKNKRRRTEISLEDTLNFDAEGNTLSLEDVLGTDEDIVATNYEKNQEKRYLENELKRLEPREKLIMSMRYGLNNKQEYTQKEVAEILGISQSYISRIEKKIINRIKNTLSI